MRGAAAAIAFVALLSGCSGEPATVEPPPLIVGVNGTEIAVPPYDYCWETGGIGTCADWFGSQEPTPVPISATTLQLEWLQDGELTGWFGPGREEDCRTMRLSIRPDQPGQWTVTLPEGTGTYKVGFHGSAAEGTTNFDILVTATGLESPVDVGCPNDGA